jgi:hypothetical protein
MKTFFRLPDGTYERKYFKHIFSFAQPTPPTIDIPPMAPPQQEPTAKPKSRGIQQSFLSGAAMAQQQGAGGGGSTGGKTLLGQ